MNNSSLIIEKGKANTETNDFPESYKQMRWKTDLWEGFLEAVVYIEPIPISYMYQSQGIGWGIATYWLAMSSDKSHNSQRGAICSPICNHIHGEKDAHQTSMTLQYCLNNIIWTHWGWVTQICNSKLTIIGSDNGLSPCWWQAIIWTNAGILLILTLGTKISEI